MNKNVWVEKNISKFKSEIKAELDSFYIEQGNQFKFHVNLKAQYIRKRITELANSVDSEQRVRCLIYILSLLNHKLKYDTADHGEVNQLVELAMDILTVERVDIRKSRFSYFYWDLYYFSSQLKEGSLESLWERELGSFLVSKTPEIRKIYDILFKADCNYRLGNIKIALGSYKLLIETALVEDFIPDLIRDKSYLGVVRSHRMQANTEEALSCIQKFRELISSSSVLKEIEWEYECCVIQGGKSEEALAMVKMVDKKKDHFLPVYLLEAFLWEKLLPLKKSRKSKLLKFRTLIENRSLDFSYHKSLLKICKNIESAYNQQVPIQHRFLLMKKNLELIPSIRAIDHKLLIYYNLALWLYNNKFKDLAAITMIEYESLSLRVSSCQSNNVLNLSTHMNSNYLL